MVVLDTQGLVQAPLPTDRSPHGKFVLMFPVFSASLWYQDNANGDMKWTTKTVWIVTMCSGDWSVWELDGSREGLLHRHGVDRTGVIMKAGTENMVQVVLHWAAHDRGYVGSWASDVYGSEFFLLVFMMFKNLWSLNNAGNGAWRMATQWTYWTVTGPAVVQLYQPAPCRPGIL